MGQNSKIEWTDHTFNPWWGCVRVSSGCVNCYAESISKRFGYDLWSTDRNRRFFSDKHWNEPRKWNQKAKELDTPVKVFVGSMCDVFEDLPKLEKWRNKLWKLISDTPDLVWLILTKRPENIERMVPHTWMTNSFPLNVWLGVSIESQSYLYRLACISEFTVGRFVSIEPMLGSVNLGKFWYLVDWVIVGGESGPNARPMHPNWIWKLKEFADECTIPFFFKQWGEWVPSRLATKVEVDKVCIWSDGRRANEWSLWDDDDGTVMYRVGKKRAGNDFYGETLQEFPCFYGYE